MLGLLIKDVEAFTVSVPAPDPAYRWREGLRGSGGGEVGILRIRTDDGVCGVASAAKPGSGAVLSGLVDRVLRDELVGQDATRREWLWERLWNIDRTEYLPIHLLGVVDTALWDLAGRAAGVPVWQLLGGYRTAIPAYASTVTFTSVEEYLDVADQCLELGYPAIKLHAWGDPVADAKLSLALREHVGPDVPLMFDGSAGFDLPDALYVGRALSEAGYLWYEEPIREYSITSYKWLAERVDVPLNVAETVPGAHMSAADYLASGCATYLRTSAGLRGGITGAMRIAHLADAFRIRAEVHGNTIANRHLCMAIPNTTYYESLVTSNPVRREWGIDGSGVVSAPPDPGIGLAPGPDYPAELQEFIHAV
ncbi:L-alanine-DL-glutamate epimerase-like enolase superfamily enzyme [Streptomyces sp. AK010]|nr:L-alanine-DL-glutamate epimerase-like enolase superfamily enzyme [Streptomyces sp. AK010]